MKTTLVPTDISGNEITFLNEHPVQIVHMADMMELPAGGSIFFVDPGTYYVRVLENDLYEGATHPFVIKARKEIETEVPGRIVLDQADEIAAAREEAYASVQRQAEDIALLFISPGNRQAMSYQEKARQAALFAANPAIAETEIPHIVVEAANYGRTVAEQADLILTMHAQWRQIDPMIEAKRLAARDAITAAESVEQIQELAVIDWSAVRAYAS